MGEDDRRFRLGRSPGSNPARATHRKVGARSPRRRTCSSQVVDGVLGPAAFGHGEGELLLQHGAGYKIINDRPRTDTDTAYQTLTVELLPNEQA